MLIEPGAYVANVKVSFPLSLVASPGALKTGIEKKGFTRVVVSDKAPTTWPLKTDADYFVHAAWDKTPTPFDLPKQVKDYKRIA